MTRVVIHAYKQTSRSARKLQEALDEQDVHTLLVYPEKIYKPRTTDFIIGWGAGEWPTWRQLANDAESTWRNKSSAVMQSINKDTAFRRFRENRIPVPEVTDSGEIANRWLLAGHIVIARRELEGHDGSGVVVITNPDQLISAPLYTKYVEKTDEFRVHVWNGRAFWGQIREPITDRNSKYFRRTPDNRIRTSANGWTLLVYWRDMPRICQQVAEEAIAALDLDFGAVDIGYDANTRRAVVYETNTSPELSERTCAAYVKQIITELEDIG